MDKEEIFSSLSPAEQPPRSGAIAVIGGGIAGTQAALDLATSGLKVFLLEKEASLGGVMAQLDKTFPTNDCSMCILSPKLVEIARHPGIEIMTGTSLTGLKGEAGNFTATVRCRARFVDPVACTGCGLCAEKCPVQVPNEYDEGLGPRKAIYIPFAQAVPLVYTIDQEACRDCGICAKVCPADAVRYEDEDREQELEVGALVLAPGFRKFDCSGVPQYSYEQCPDIISAVEFERLLSANGPTGGHLERLSDGAPLRRVAFIQCTGSRDATHNPYCSSICCMASVKEAIIAREHEPELQPEIFYMDMRAVGKDFERFYRRAKDDMGIEFTRALVAEINPMPDGKVSVVHETAEGIREKEFDMVVLASALESLEEARELADIT
jgi:heterodisulfide reductase subunit A